jgi:hypothetical protein
MQHECDMDSSFPPHFPKDPAAADAMTCRLVSLRAAGRRLLSRGRVPPSPTARDCAGTRGGMPPSVAARPSPSSSLRAVFWRERNLIAAPAFSYTPAEAALFPPFPPTASARPEPRVKETPSGALFLPLTCRLTRAHTAGRLCLLRGRVEDHRGDQPRRAAVEALRSKRLQLHRGPRVCRALERVGVPPSSKPPPRRADAVGAFSPPPIDRPRSVCLAPPHQTCCSTVS